MTNKGKLIQSILDYILAERYEPIDQMHAISGFYKANMKELRHILKIVKTVR